MSVKSIYFKLKKINIRFLAFALLAVVLLEATLFNFRYFTSQGLTPANVDLSQYEANKVNGFNTYKFGQDSVNFEINYVNRQIKNILIDAEYTDKESKSTAVIDVAIEATDKGNKHYFRLPDRVIVRNLEKSKYIPLSLNGESEKIKIIFNNISNKEITINKIELNVRIPFFFNIIRVAVLYLIIILLHIIRPRNKYYSYKLNLKRRYQRAILISLIIINSLIYLGLGLAHPDKTINEVSHHHQYHRLTEAILNGHFYLDLDVASYLTKMNNPYDRKERDRLAEETSERYQWDTAYFDGKYYVYFGITPVLVCFLPTTLLGMTILNKVVVILFTIISCIFAYLIIFEVAKRWFSDTSYLLVLLMSFVFANSIGSVHMIKVAHLYEIPLSNALAFMLIALFCFIKALPRDVIENEEGHSLNIENNTKNNKINNTDNNKSALIVNNTNASLNALALTPNGSALSPVYLCLGAIFMALIAGCRPQLLICIALVVALFFKHTFKQRELFSKRSVVATTALMMPFVLFGAFIMFYNYSRFGSVFDFGANYNLTVMDMTAEGFRFGKIPLGIFAYFFQPPRLTTQFPFLKMVDIETTFMGSYVKEGVFGGMLICYVLLLALFFLRNVKAELVKRDIWYFTLLMPILAVIIAMLDFNTGGLVFRYMIDFQWLMFLSAIIVIFALHDKYANTPFYTLLLTVVGVAFIWCISYDFILMFSTEGKNYKDDIPGLFYLVKYAFSFWL